MTAFRVGTTAIRATEPPSPRGIAATTVSNLLDEPTLRSGLNAAGRRELLALAEETDSGLFFEGLMAFGSRLEQADRVESAAVIYSTIVGAVRERPLQSNAQLHLDALMGRGAFGPRAEFLLRRLARETASPSLLLGMAGAQAVFGLSRLALLSRLSASPSVNLLTRGFGAKALASTGAFFLEAPSFVAFTRGAGLLLGQRQEWSTAALGREVAGSFLTLGALKLAGAASNSVFRRIHGHGAPSVGAQHVEPLQAQWSQSLFQQAGILGGIFLGHSLETRLGLRPQVDGATTLVDSLAMLLQFHVGGRLLHQASPRLQAWNHSLNLRSEAAAGLRPPPPRPGHPLPRFETIPTFAGGSAPSLNPRGAMDQLVPDRLFMTAQGPWDAGMEPRPAASEVPLSGGEVPARSRLRIMDGGAARVSNFVFPTLPDSCRCLVVEYRGEAPTGGRHPRHLESLLQRLRNGFAEHPQLEELRLRFSDGSVLFLHRDGDGTIHESRESREAAGALEDWNRHPPESIHPMEVIAPWTPQKIETRLPEFLRELRRGSGLTQVQVAQRIEALTLETKDYNAVSRYERSSDAAIPFRALQALAEIYGVEVRTLIQVSNQSRFPEIPASRWTTRDYPIYLESAADLQRLEFFADQDPRHAGFGWLIYSARKNPFHYQNTVDLKTGTGLNSNAFSRLETHRNTPSLRAIQGLARTLNLPETLLIDRANRTFFSELNIEALFPGQSPFIDPLADDPRKVRAYAAAPGSLGQRLFAYRKSLPSRPGVTELSRRFGHHDNYWGEREMNKIPTDAGNWRDWYDLLTRTGLPLDPIRPFLGGKAAPEQSPSVIFHEALQGEALANFVARTGFDKKGLSLILGSNPRGILAETILDLQNSLPSLKGALFYRALRPELTSFFPEAASNPPVLNLNREHVAEAMALNLGEALYQYRMEHGIDLAQMAKRLGVADNTMKNYETISVRIDNPEVLRRAAEILNLDPRVVYLHYHPQLLRLFSLNPEPMDTAEYRYWTRERAEMRDSGNLRERLYAAAQAEGIADPKTLAAQMDIPEGPARKYWQKIHPLTVGEIQRLTDFLPTLSYREWYEHFQGHALAYFLGRRVDGEIDYSLPEGWNYGNIAHWPLKIEIRRAIAERYASSRAVAEQIGVGFLARNENLNRSLKDLSWTNDTIARVARGLGLDRRLIFLYFRSAELRPMLEPPIQIKNSGKSYRKREEFAQ